MKVILCCFQLLVELYIPQDTRSEVSCSRPLSCASRHFLIQPSHVGFTVQLYILPLLCSRQSARTMRRQKRRPDTLHLNVVDSVRNKSRSVRIRREEYPVILKPPTPPLSGREHEGGGPEHSQTEGTEPVHSQLDLALEPQPDPNDLGCSDHKTDHTRRKEKLAEGWADLRTKMVSTRIAVWGFPQGIICTFCKIAQASVWCGDCGPLVYLCEGCTDTLHGNINVLHSPLLWKVKLYSFVNTALSIRFIIVVTSC